MSGPETIGAAMLAMSLAGSLMLLPVAGGFALVFTAGALPALGYLLSGAPKSIVVEPGSISIQYHLRAARVVSREELDVQVMEDEVVLVTPSFTTSLDASRFVGGMSGFVAAVTNGG